MRKWLRINLTKNTPDAHTQTPELTVLDGDRCQNATSAKGNVYYREAAVCDREKEMERVGEFEMLNQCQCGDGRLRDFGGGEVYTVFAAWLQDYGYKINVVESVILTCASVQNACTLNAPLQPQQDLCIYWLRERCVYRIKQDCMFVMW